MSTDRVTQEQRRGIHERARKLGTNEGLRSGINQFSSYIPEVGKLSLYALGIVIDANDDEQVTQKARFDAVDWAEMGAETLEDLTALSPEELASTQPSLREGEVFAAAVVNALRVFNLQR